MSEPINTFYAYFDTYDFTNTLSLSSYALPFCNLTFKLRDSEILGYVSNTRVVWDFGDGTIVEAITGIHNYTVPGEYKVTCYLYNSAGEAFFNTYNQQIIVRDFITPRVEIFNPLSSYTLTASQINTPITIHNYISWQNTDINLPASIIPFCSGADNNFFNADIYSKRYNYLYPFSSFYTLVDNNGVTEFTQISSILPQYTSLFCKVSNSQIVFTDSSDTLGFFCGLSGESVVYFKDDISRPIVNLFFGYDSNILYPAANTSTVGISAEIVDNPSANNLSINSNGITSEGTTTESFAINLNKFNNTKISFTVKIKDSSNFTNKNLNINTSLSSSIIPSTFKLQLKLMTGNTVIDDATFYSDESIMQSLSGGIFKGYVVTDIPTTTNVYISASLIDSSLSAPIYGVSNTFNIYNKNHFSIAKYGEDIDLTAKFKDLAFQPLFADTPKLFDDFLGSIFGNLYSSPNEQVGKRTYEKITNFVDNTSTLDYSNIENLIGLCKQYGVDVSNYGKSNYLYPSDIRRLVDLLSINFSRLRGGEYLSNNNFDDRGYTDSSLYSNNKGDEVSLNYTVTAGYDLIAYEKYSGTYKRVNTYLPLCASNITLLTDNTYSLSSYNNTWGWGLILPGTFNSLSEYYEFYSYTPSITGDQVGGKLNYNDVTNTLSITLSSYEDWSKKDGIISNILANQLYVGLDLFNK